MKGAAMFGMLRTLTTRLPGMAPVDAISKSKSGDIVLVDIRDPSEVKATGRAKGAVMIPLAVLRVRADPSSPECHPDIRSGKPVVVYCATGARSGMAGKMLKSMGVDEVYNMGSLHQWQAAGGKVVR